MIAADPQVKIRNILGTIGQQALIGRKKQTEKPIRETQDRKRELERELEPELARRKTIT